MSRKSSTPSWLPGAILFSGVVSYFLFIKTAKGAESGPKSNVQTAIVGDRVYSVTRLGQGHYIVSLISTGGVIEASPVNFVFSQTQQLGSIGSAEKLTQLKSDMNSFNVNFAA